MSAVGRWTTSVAAMLRIARRADAVVLLASALLVTAVATGIVAAERAVDRAENDSLALALRTAPPESTRLVIDVTDVFTPSGSNDPLVVPRRKLEAAAQAIDPLVLSVYADARIVIDAPSLAVNLVDDQPTQSPTRVVVRVPTGLDDHATLSSGSEPARAEPIDDRDVLEVTLSTGAADEIGWAVGSELLVSATTDDPLFRGFDSLPDPFIVRVAGLIDLDDPTDPYWFGDDRLHRVGVEDTGVGANLTMYASLTEQQLPMLISILGGQTALRVEQRWDLDTGGIDMSNVADVERAVRATEAATSSTAAFGSPAVRFGLGAVLDAESNRRETARDAIRIAAIGIAAVSIAIFVQLQRVAADRRRPWWIQVRSRGAGVSPMVTASLLSTAVITIGGVLVGAVVARALVPDSAATATGLLVAFGVALVVADVVVQLSDARGTLDATPVANRPPSRWTRAGAVLVVVVAVASVSTLRRSGIVAGGDGIDIVVLLPIAVVPIAVAVVLRAIVSLVLGGRSFGGLGSGVGRLVGRRRASETRSAAALIIAVALAASVATVSAVIAWTLRGRSSDAGDLTAAARDAFAAAALGTWVLGLVSVATATVITMRRRRVDAELLRALGAPRSEFDRAVAAELMPLIGAGLVAGAIATSITTGALNDRLDIARLGATGSPGLGVLAGATVTVMGSLFLAAVCVVRVAAASAHRRTGSASPRPSSEAGR